MKKRESMLARISIKRLRILVHLFNQRKREREKESKGKHSEFSLVNPGDLEGV